MSRVSCGFCFEDFHVPAAQVSRNILKQRILNREIQAGDEGFFCEECCQEMDDEQRNYVKQLRALSYREYLKTRHWQRRRSLALSAAMWSCQVCSSQRRLQVHHRTYERLGAEIPEDLTVLCSGCHKTFHEHRSLA